MSAPAGLCEWCGGPQQWTFASGVMYVRCLLGCLPLFVEDLPPTKDLVVPVARKLPGRYREASVGVGGLCAVKNNPGRMPGSVQLAVDSLDGVQGKRG